MPAVDGGEGERGEGAGEQDAPADPGKRGTDAGGELGITETYVAWSDDRQGQVEAREGGGADGRAAEVARLVSGERGNSQQCEGCQRRRRR